MEAAIKDKDGILVEELVKLLSRCPKGARLQLNHSVQIPFEGDDGKTTVHRGWVFDPVTEVRMEEIEDAGERYPEFQSGGCIVWLTHESE